MTIFANNAFQTVQGGTQASTPNPPASPNTNQQLRDAAQQLREAIQNNVRQEVNQARAQVAAERALRDQGVIVKTPTVSQGPSGFGPFAGGPVTIQTPDGKTTIIQRGGPAENVIPPQVEDISIAFFLTVAAIIIFLPLARAFARRMDRRSAAPQIPPEVSAQLNQLNQAVDAIALEVERISEGQRFTTRLLTEQREAAPGITSGANR